MSVCPECVSGKHAKGWWGTVHVDGELYAQARAGEYIAAFEQITLYARQLEGEAE